VDLKEDKVREKVMQEFERYKVNFKSKVRIRMTKLTLTKTREDGSILEHHEQEPKLHPTPLR
jgi:hypothetical protein